MIIYSTSAGSNPRGIKVFFGCSFSLSLDFQRSGKWMLEVRVQIQIQPKFLVGLKVAIFSDEGF